MISPSPTYELDVSMWEKRGWTLQERTLSRRLLAFTTNQVYLSCRKTQFLEDTVSELATRDITIKDFPDQSTDWNRFYIDDDSRGSLEHYRNLVRECTMRKISYSGDGLNACIGLLSDYRKRTKKDDSRFAFGLPLSDFTAALCWSACPHKPESRRQGFPSWSWAGWSNLAQYLESGFNADVEIGSNMVKSAEDAVSDEGRFCQRLSPRPLQDLDPLSPILRFEAVLFKLRVSREEETKNRVVSSICVSNSWARSRTGSNSRLTRR